MATPEKQPVRQLTSDESELRGRAKKRENLQRHITSNWWQYTDNRIVEQLRQAHTRLIAWGNKSKPVDTDHHPVSPWTPDLQQLVDTDTIRHPVTPLPLSRITDKPITPRLLNSLPNTGEVMNKLTQDKQPDKVPTTHHTYQDALDELKYIQQKLVAQGQDAIRGHYQARFITLHPDEEFFEDFECMPHTIKMTAMNNLTLSPLLDEGKYFPGTRVLVVLDKTLGDQMICE